MPLQKKYPQGYFTGLWMGIGIALFSGFGIPLSIATGNYGLIGIGPAIGVSVGVLIGAAIEAKYVKEGKIRTLTDAERKKRKIVSISGLALLFGLLILLLVLSFFKLL